MKKLYLAVALVLGLAVAEVSAADTLLSVGATMEMTYFKNIKDFKFSEYFTDVKNAYNGKSLVFGPEIKLISFPGMFCGLYLDANMVFKSPILPKEDWGMVDFNLGPAFRVPFGNIFALLFGVAADFRMPIKSCSNMYVGAGGMAGFMVGLGSKFFIDFTVNMAYDFYDVKNKQKATYLVLRPTLGGGIRLGS